MQCVICGRTEDHGCPDGCFWVFQSPPICSRCVFDQLATASVGFDEPSRFDIAERLMQTADRIHPEYDQQVAAMEDQIEREGFPPDLWIPGDGT